MVAMAMVLALFALATMAEASAKKWQIAETTHVVKKGEFLSMIAKKYGDDWKEVAKRNGISDPSLIHPGQELKVNVYARAWYKLGQAPLNRNFYMRKIGRYDFQKLGKAMGLNGELVRELEEKLRNGDYRGTFIIPQYDNGYPVVQYEIMTFAGYRTSYWMAPAWPNGAAVPVYRTQLSNGKFYDLITVCGNFGLYIGPESYFPKPPPVVKAEPPPLTKEKSPPSPPEELKEKSPPSPLKDPPKKSLLAEMEAWLGATWVRNAENDDIRHQSVWGLIKATPIKIKFLKKKFKVGGYGFGSIAGGVDKPNDYTYKDKRLGAGLAAKYQGRGKTYDLSIGLFKIWSEGNGRGGYSNKQTDFGWSLDGTYNNYSRRAKKKKWFPETEVRLYGDFPLTTKQEHSVNGVPLASQPWDKQSAGLVANFFVRDTHLTKKFFISSGLTVGTGYEWGPEEQWGKIGPIFKARWFGQEIFQFEPLTYQAQLTDWVEKLNQGPYRLLITEGWVKVDSLYRAYKAYRIREASTAERALR